MIIAAAILLINSTRGHLLIYVFSFSLLWLNLGGWLAIAPAATARYFGEKNYSKNYGILFTAYGVGAVLGTILSGTIRDTLGSYIFVFYPVILLAVLGIFISLKFVKQPTNQNTITKKTQSIQ
jgi:MFS family permease